MTDKPICKSAHFALNDITYAINCVDDVTMHEIRKDPKTGMQRHIEGYPMFFTPTGQIYPTPIKGIEVIYV